MSGQLIVKVAVLLGIGILVAAIYIINIRKELK